MRPSDRAAPSRWLRPSRPLDHSRCWAGPAPPSACSQPAPPTWPTGTRGVQPDPRPPAPATGNTLERALTPISNDDRTIWIRSRAQTLSTSIIQATRALGEPRDDAQNDAEAVGRNQPHPATAAVCGLPPTVAVRPRA